MMLDTNLLVVLIIKEQLWRMLAVACVHEGCYFVCEGYATLS